MDLLQIPTESENQSPAEDLDHRERMLLEWKVILDKAEGSLKSKVFDIRARQEAVIIKQLSNSALQNELSTKMDDIAKREIKIAELTNQLSELRAILYCQKIRDQNHAIEMEGLNDDSIGGSSETLIKDAAVTDPKNHGNTIEATTKNSQHQPTKYLVKRSTAKTNGFKMSAVGVFNCNICGHQTKALKKIYAHLSKSECIKTRKQN